MKKRVAFYTFGCKLNGYETEALKGTFHAHDYQIVEYNEVADVYVINTCSVTERADAEARRIIRQASRNNPEALVVVTGCYAQRDPQAIARLTGVNLVLGNAEKGELYRLVDQKLREKAATPEIRVRNLRREGGPGFAFPPIDPSAFSRFTRATIKVQDGCDEFCSFCIIPYTRGRSVSRPLADVVAHARRLVEAGYKEIDLTGVHTGNYGRDLPGKVTLLSLLQELEKIEGLQRIRLNSLEPSTISEELIDFIACSRKVCHHLHIPLQSGDDEILRRMKRNYDAATYADLITRIHQRMPECGIGADIIVGFPGEEERHFASTRQLVERLPLTYLHVFSFSVRQGTPAARYAGHLPPEVITERSALLRKLGQQKKQAFARRFLGRTLPILVESKREKETGLFTGLSENYIRVVVDAPESLINEIVPVRIVRVTKERVEGTLCPAPALTAGG
ncbi:MAG: tRNA (N(6)-L-threonylcarbamoyladenosine(37)-C(2))-methylthiotransferase MtaB [Nitrospinota bacterium]|nr:MAG: tRNA (N(6)-L-threonylcarbamoyladenosine(37)-C(2))-methylthiotransferase MtaB [Nitrospinota bacterium]